MSNLAAPAGYSSSDLVFNDSFTGTTLGNSWNTYVTSKAASGNPWASDGKGGSGIGAQYDAEYYRPSQISVNDGLTLTAIKQSTVGIDQTGSAYTFPVTSGAVSSYGKFEFTGGYLQISMDAPTGNGAWPALWLLPGSGANTTSDNFEIDMQEGGMTNGSSVDGNMAWHLHTSSGTFGGVTASGTDLTTGFHTYGIDWQPGKSITWYLDGKQIGQLTSAQCPIPNEPMEVVMTNQVGNTATNGWHTMLDGSTPSSMDMKVGNVQLYQKAGTSGQTLKGGNISASNPGTPTAPTQPVNVAPTVNGVTTNPASGVEHVGDKVAFTVAFSEAVTVGGQPTLTLNDGSVATYVGGSGSDKLTFSTTVASTDKSVSALGITALNLPNGATIKDSGGLAANVSGAVKTFTGLSVDTSAVVTQPTPPVSQPVAGPTKPTLTVPSQMLMVSPGGKIDLGIKVSTTDANDSVSVNIRGLPNYETITDGQGHTYRGNNINLTMAQVQSGLTLSSNYKGTDSPIANLQVTATAKDPATGTTATSTATVVVKDPPPSATTTPTTPVVSAPPAGEGTVTNPTTPSAPASPSTPVVSDPKPGQGASHGGRFDVGQWLDSHPDFTKAIKTLTDAFATRSQTSVAAAAPQGASAGDRAFALFNQMMAGDFGQSSHFASGISSAAQGQSQSSPLLARPLH